MNYFDTRKVGLYSRASFIYKFKTSTLTPFVKPRNLLNLAVRNIFLHFYIQSWVTLKNTLNVESYMMSFNQSECINNKVVFKLRNSFERVAAKMDKCSINKKLSDQF